MASSVFATETGSGCSDAFPSNGWSKGRRAVITKRGKALRRFDIDEENNRDCIEANQLKWKKTLDRLR
jgi:hypothetical protein